MWQFNWGVFWAVFVALLGAFLVRGALRAFSLLRAMNDESKNMDHKAIQERLDRQIELQEEALALHHRQLEVLEEAGKPEDEAASRLAVAAFAARVVSDIDQASEEHKKAQG